MTIEQFIKMAADDNSLTITRLSERIGRKNSTLGVSLRNDSLSVKDLKKSLEELGHPLVLVYKGREYEIDLKK